ncbi:MAG: hypothetical protein J1E02_09430 [Coprobacter sp.]|nr:hypothetical protein [Coprobacter sp.]
MKMRLTSVLVLLGWLLTAAAGAQAASPAGGEKQPGAAVQTAATGNSAEQRLHTRTASLDPTGEETEIYSADGYIYIRTPKRQETKVFTILGQMVFAGYAGPGLTEIQMQPRGIYIVKVGTITQRVAL